MTTQTPLQALLTQSPGIRALISDLMISESGQESFRLVRFGSLSPLSDTEAGLSCVPQAFQTLSISFGDTAKALLADHIRTGDLSQKTDATLVDFLDHNKNTPSAVTRAAQTLVNYGFGITAINQEGRLSTTIMFRLGAHTGIRAELTWLR